LRTSLLFSGVLLVSCSSNERGRSTPTHDGNATIELLKAHAELSARVTGLPLVHAAEGFAPRAERPRLRVQFPARANGTMRLTAAEGLWIEVIADDLESVGASPVAGALLFAAAAPDLDVVMSANEAHVEELRLLRSPKAPATSRYRLHLGPEVSDVRVRMGMIEVLDRRGVARLRSDPWFAVDAKHRRIDIVPRLSGEGASRLLEATVDVAGATHPIAVDPGWGTATAMAFARADHTATVLPGGKVLVVGGETFSTTMLSAAELYDPTTRTWTLAKAMATPRALHTATVLGTGKVVITGGATGVTGGGYATATSSIEVYDPATDTWSTAAAALSKTRHSHVAALLSPSGNVLVAGGIEGTTATYFQDAEVWDPTKSATTAVTNSSTSFHARGGAFPFGTNRVLVVGSDNENEDKGDVYDGATNAFTSAPALSIGRSRSALVGLADGRVLVAGGRVISSGLIESTAEMFNPGGGAFAGVAAMPGPKFAAGAVFLSTNKILVAGGIADDTSTTAHTATHLYDVATNTWSTGAALAGQRQRAAMAPLPGGGALITGGVVGVGTTTVTNTVEAWGDAIAKGAECFSAGACAVGLHCVDGVCCDRACTGQCESCKETSSVGTCKLISGAPKGGRAACTGTGTCAGSCDGVTSACTYPSASTVCTPAACIGGTSTDAAFCDGKGVCGTPPASTDCAPFGCGATGCKTSCATGADCVTSAFCDVNKCVTKKKQGDACTGAEACVTGFCESGVCCATACSGGCNACNVPGSVGVCSSIPGCTDAGVPDAGGVVDAVVDAVAETPAPDWGATPTVPAGFQRCRKNGECASGHCVEGVCCDTACADRCHSCALLTSPGKCTPEPTGVDLRSECGAALACVGTCGPGAQCIGAGKGTMCARNRCTGPSSGVGPAFCSAPGGACSTDEAVPFECGPYLCEPAFGACSTACVSSDDCARGYVCDVPSKTCVAIAPPAEEDSGCSIAAPGASGRSGPAIAFLMLCAALANVRARNRRG